MENKKIIETEISEAEFDKFVIEQNLGILEQTDESIHYGVAFGSDITYKNYKNKDGADAYKIVQIAPQEITCGKCHLKIHTGYHDVCPVCEASLAEMIEKNRGFNDRIHDFKTEMNAEYQERHEKFNNALIEEYGFNF